MKTLLQEKQRPSHDEIARTAYRIWEERGRPQGRDLEFWVEAERQLLLSDKPRQDQFANPLRSAGSSEVQAQPNQTAVKPASVAQSPTEGTRKEIPLKQLSPRAGVSSARRTKPGVGAVARP